MGRSRSRSRDRYRERSRDRGGGGGSYRDRSPPRRGGGGGGGGRDRDEACSLLVRNLSDRVEGRGMKYACTSEAAHGGRSRCGIALRDVGGWGAEADWGRGPVCARADLRDIFDRYGSLRDVYIPTDFYTK